VTDDGICVLGKFCPSLQVLSVREGDITPASIACLPSGCKVEVVTRPPGMPMCVPQLPTGPLVLVQQREWVGSHPLLVKQEAQSVVPGWMCCSGCCHTCGGCCAIWRLLCHDDDDETKDMEGDQNAV
jgi:hypothetical protein